MHTYTCAVTATAAMKGMVTKGTHTCDGDVELVRLDAVGVGGHAGQLEGDHRRLHISHRTNGEQQIRINTHG